MSDGQTLFLVLSLIYLVECFLWVRKQSVAFLSPWLRRVNIATASFGNAYGGFLIMNPLPPLGYVFLSHLSPVSISPMGVCAFNVQALPSVGRPTQSGRSLAFAEIVGASVDGAYLLINNERFSKCATAAQARAISELINKTAGVPPSDREAIILSYTAKQFAEDEIARISREGSSFIKPIRLMCTILFLFLFVATPILVGTFGLLRFFFPVALLMLGFAIQISVMFHRARKALFPDESRLDQMITMILCPPVAIRAADLLTRDLLSLYNPVVVASLLAGTRAQQFVRAFVLDLQHPIKHVLTDETSVEIINWAREKQLGFCLEHLKHSSYLKPEVLLTSPEPSGDSISFCPRCECQFVVSAGECPDCPGLELVRFSEQLAIINRASA
jgi:hypothetical protein